MVHRPRISARTVAAGAGALPHAVAEDDGINGPKVGERAKYEVLPGKTEPSALGARVITPSGTWA